MKPINDTLKILLLAAAYFALVELGLFFIEFRSAAKEASATMAEAKAAVSELRVYSREQLARLRDPRNSKAIDAAIQTAAVFNGTGRLINTQLIPRAMKTLDGLVNIALPIVDELSTIDPKTARLKEVADAYRKYGVPMIQSYTQDPTSIGNALLNLGTQILRSKLPKDKVELPTNILNTAVQLAVTALKA